MTERDEDFVHRWARRARQARREQAPEPADPPATEPVEPLGPAPDCEEPVLPPIESLDADSDYTAFLARDVPKVLKLAALRKAWTSHPAITAHKPLVDYDWDCNAPGYGKLRPDDLTGKLARNLLRHFRPKEERDDESPVMAKVAWAPAEDPTPSVAEDLSEPVPRPSTEEKRQDTNSDPAPPVREEISGDRVSFDDQDERPRNRHGSARPG